MSKDDDSPEEYQKFLMETWIHVSYTVWKYWRTRKREEAKEKAENLQKWLAAGNSYNTGDGDE